MQDPLLHTATMEIMPDGKARNQVQTEIRKKNEAIKLLRRKYATEQRRQANRGGYFPFMRYHRDEGDESEAQIGCHGDAESLTEDTIEQCIYSLGDHNTYLRFNREPCDRLILYLKKYFAPGKEKDDPRVNLQIHEGKDGARFFGYFSRRDDVFFEFGHIISCFKRLL